ncbi:alpha/beta hydrolase [Burkholderia multivorans]|uniref:alpha/beta hydrolase n=1 Tax=Burkholderia multivorans TaxID=87883 RepID=UPI00158A6B8F|nr:alpha/beta hydrolase [Burkholderia multivorans]
MSPNTDQLNDSRREETLPPCAALPGAIARIANPRVSGHAIDSAPVSIRLSLLDWLLKATGQNKIDELSDDIIVAGQKPLPRNWLIDLVFGKPADDVDIRFRAGEAIVPPLRLYVPSGQRKARSGLLYLHGGGWVSGDPGMTDWWCSHYAARTGTIVASVDYRLAPQHRFPAGLLDAYSALQALHGDADSLGIERDSIGVAGDSAGANLAAALTLLARNQPGLPIAMQILICPALDLRFDSPSMDENSDAPLLSAAMIRAYARRYLGDPSAADSPYVSPLLANDLSELPPALIQVAEHDPLRDDGWRYHARLKANGVSSQITEYAGAPHGLTTFPGLTPLSERALVEASEFQFK